MAGAAWGQSVWEPPDASTPHPAQLQPTTRATQGQGTAGLTLRRAALGLRGWRCGRAQGVCPMGPAGTAPRRAGGREEEATPPDTPGAGHSPAPRLPAVLLLPVAAQTPLGLTTAGRRLWEPSRHQGPLPGSGRRKETFGGKQICSISVAARGAVRALPPNSMLPPGLHTDGRLVSDQPLAVTAEGPACPERLGGACF